MPGTLVHSLNIKTVLFHVNQLSISMQFTSIWPMDRALSGSTTLGQSGPGSNSNEGVLCIPQSPSITGTSPSDCLGSYPGHLLGAGESYPSAEVQSVYSTSPADCAIWLRVIVPVRVPAVSKIDLFTEYMCYNQTGDITTLDGASLKLVDKFTYLGSSVSSTEKDIDTRLTKTWTAIDRLLIIWKSDLTDKMKHSFFQAAVVSILLYGCTTWTLTKRL